MVPEVKVCVGGQSAGRQDHPPSKIVADVQITLYDVGERLSGPQPYPDSSRSQKDDSPQCLSRNTHLGELDGQRIQGTSMKAFRPQLRKADMSLSESFGVVAFKWSLEGRGQMVREEWENCCRGSNTSLCIACASSMHDAGCCSIS